MKKRITLLAALLIAIALLSLAASARAAPLQVDRGRIYKDIVQDRPRGDRDPQAEVGLSTWRPHDPDFSRFKDQGVPELTARLVIPAFRAGSVDMSGVIGVGYLGLTRSEPVILSNNVHTMNDRQISILEMPIGLEVAPRMLSVGHLSGFAEIGALPSLFVYGHSLDDDGHSNAGFSGYGDLGAIYNFGGTRFDSFSLVATAGYRARVSGDVDTKGFAARFGLRVGL